MTRLPAALLLTAGVLLAAPVPQSLSDKARPIAEDSDPAPEPGRRVFTDYGEAKRTAEKLNEPLLVSFWMENCPPCAQLKRTKAQPAIAKLLADNYVICDVDVNQDQRTTRAFRVTSVPLEVVVHKGLQYGRHNTITPAAYVAYHTAMLAKIDDAD